MNAPASIRHLKIAGILVLGVIIWGIIGSIFIEHLSFIDALYSTIDTMATIGSIAHPLGVPARLFSLSVVIFGVGSLLYTLSAGMEFMIEGHFSHEVRRHLMESRIAKLRGHAIICGFGRVGSQIAEDCVAARRLFVVIDEQEQNIQKCIQRGYLAIRGDATNDDVLREAGVQHAQCVLVATDSDAFNISITLSARHLNNDLLIIARANHDETTAKLKRAGADRVLSPYTIGGHRMANLAFQTGVVEFFDLVTRAGDLELAMQEVVIGGTSSLAGKTMADVEKILADGIVIIALKKQSGPMTIPARESRLAGGDTLIVVGLPEQLAKFKEKHL